MRYSAFLLEVDKTQKTGYNNSCYHTLKLACAQVCGLSRKGDYDGEKRNGNKTDDIGCGI